MREGRVCVTTVTVWEVKCRSPICKPPLPPALTYPPAIVTRGARVMPTTELKRVKAPIFMGRVSGV